ncbi:hypothetical protein Tco_1076053, partial [Tanacetum coccineum]
MSGSPPPPASHRRRKTFPAEFSGRVQICFHSLPRVVQSPPPTTTAAIIINIIITPPPNPHCRHITTPAANIYPPPHPHIRTTPRHHRRHVTIAEAQEGVRSVSLSPPKGSVWVWFSPERVCLESGQQQKAAFGLIMAAWGVFGLAVTHTEG